MLAGRATAALGLAVLAVLLACAPAHAAGLRAGVGKADVTPQTGYYLGGWTRADRVAGGQHTRLHARALVLERDGRKVALVSLDLFMVPGGMVKHVGDALRSRGFSEQNILISASHTHSGPGGYANFPTLNTAAPSLQTATDPFSFFRLLDPNPADRQLYTFITRQITTAIRRADADLGPAAAGWGSGRIVGLTRNRSIEAHLANHGVLKERGEGSEADDPGGYLHTIDPAVNVLRVDKLRRRRGSRRRVRVPIGAWSTFADHGTVTKSSFQFYNGDHHASAMRVFESRVRREGRTPKGQEVLNVYGNSNEGDMSAGLDRSGPAASDYVGRVEAGAMVRAWRRAGRRLSRTPALDMRWTRVCFCGQETEGGRVASASQVGIPFLTGSEEERGPLFDVTQEELEGRRAPAGTDPHGVKLSAPGVGGGVPNAVPLLAVRVGPRLIVSLPGEGTKEVGERIRTAVGSAVAGSGIEGVVLSGLANEFVLYFTTPEEYDRQHYEGGNTQFGRHSSTLMKVELAKLAGSLARGESAPAPYAFDPTNGVAPDGPPYGDGAAGARALEQPATGYRRLERATFSWQGGPLGLDRPVDRAFVVAERRRGGALDRRRQRSRPGHAVDGRRRRAPPGAVGGAVHHRHGPLPARGARQALPARVEVLLGGRRAFAGRRAGARGRGPARRGPAVPGRGARRGPDAPAAVLPRRGGAVQGRQPDRGGAPPGGPLLQRRGARRRAGVRAGRARAVIASATPTAAPRSCAEPRGRTTSPGGGSPGGGSLGGGSLGRRGRWEARGRGARAPQAAP